MSKRTRKWVTRIVIVIATLALVTLVKPIYIAGVVFEFWQPWSRPAGVSLRAHYVSQIETAEWFDCSFDEKRDVDVCTVWTDDGRKLGTGDFRLEDEDHGAPPAELHPSHVVYGDGHLWEIDLFGNQGPHSRVLVPVKAQQHQPE